MLPMKLPGITMKKTSLYFKNIKTIFILITLLSSFLLFFVQPLMGKLLLPIYGGSFSIWLTVMLFFQIALFLGYLYAYKLLKMDKKQANIVHILFALFVILFVLKLDVFSQIIFKVAAFFPNPMMTLLWMLFSTIGPPFILLSSTSMLLQIWLFETHAVVEMPYWLYSLSNIGSLFAVILYPILFETFLGLTTQMILWRILVLVYIVLLSLVLLAKKRDNEKKSQVAEKIPFKLQLKWLVLSMMGVFSLVVVTNKVTYTVASLPLLWMIPLLIYLISFIVSFSGKSINMRRLYFLYYLFALPISLLSFLSSITFAHIISLLIFLQIVLIILHKYLYDIRPQGKYHEQMPLFYLTTSFGGVLGGIIASVIPPLFFYGFWEYPLFLSSVAILIAWYLKPNFNVIKSPKLYKLKKVLYYFVVFITVLWPFSKIAFDNLLSDSQMRNFYGMTRIYNSKVFGLDVSVLEHNGIIHGFSYLDSDYTYKIMSYYGEGSGPYLGITYYQDEKPSVGVVGLGTGQLSSYCKDFSSIVYYEIDRDVIQQAELYFPYLLNCRSKTDVFLGDARKTMESQASSGYTKQYDVLIVDAFLGDSIPVHLLTKEALDLYFSLLKDDGILVLHTSNRYLDLARVLYGYKQDDKIFKYNIRSPYFDSPYTYDAIQSGELANVIKDNHVQWFIMTKNEQFDSYIHDLAENINRFRLDERMPKYTYEWTDQKNSIMGVISIAD